MTPAAASYAVDPTRVFYRRPEAPEAPYDPEAPDAVWVAVVGDSHEDVSSGEARREAARYAANLVNASDGIDKEEGPIPDDGSVRPTFLDAAASLMSNGATSAGDYLREAARHQMTPRRYRKYVSFYRVRRLAAL